MSNPGRRAKQQSGDAEQGLPEAVQSQIHKTSEPRDHLAELDALRGIAITMVVVNHLCIFWLLSVGPVTIPVLGTDVLRLLLYFAAPGVPLFFLLSGYLLTWTEGKRAERGNYSLRSYAARRVLRIVPAYYVALLVACLVVTPLLMAYRVSWVDILAHLTFLHSLTPAFARTISPQFWSLTPEVVFYCLLPLIILKLPLLWQRLVLFVVLYLIGIYTRALALQAYEPNPQFVYGQMDPHLFYSSLPIALLYLFLAGVLLRMMVERLNTRPASPLQPRIAFTLFLWSVVTFILAMPELRLLNFPTFESMGWAAVHIPRLLVQDLALVGFFASALLGAPILSRLLKWRLLGLIGLISYSMFVFHYTVILLFDNYFLGGEGVRKWLTQDAVTTWISFSFYFISMFVLIGVISHLGYRYIESPFLRIKPR